MVLNINNTGRKALNLTKKVSAADPASLMLPLAEHDTRLYFAFCINRNRFLYTNAAFKNFFGSWANQPPEIFKDFIHPQDLKYLKQCVAEMRPGILQSNIEFNLTLPGKSERRLKLSLMDNRQLNGDRVLVGYAEETVSFKVRTTVSEEYQYQKKAILNILSHDLLSPMGSIHNLAALISRKSVLQADPELSKWVSLIEVISKKSINAIQDFVEKEFTKFSRYSVNKEYV